MPPVGGGGRFSIPLAAAQVLLPQSSQQMPATLHELQAGEQGCQGGGASGLEGIGLLRRATPGLNW